MPRACVPSDRKRDVSRRPTLASRSPTFRKRPRLIIVYLLQSSGHQLQAGFHLSPTGFNQSPRHGQKRLSFPSHCRQHIPPQEQTFPGHVVGLVRKGFNQRCEYLYVPKRQVADQVRTNFEELGCQGARLPCALVQATAQAGPAGNVLGTQVGNDGRASSKERYRKSVASPGPDKSHSGPTA